MAGIIGFIGNVFGMTVATIDTVNITLGLVVAAGLVIALALRVAKKVGLR